MLSPSFYQLQSKTAKFQNLYNLNKRTILQLAFEKRRFKKSSLLSNFTNLFWIKTKFQKAMKAQEQIGQKPKVNENRKEGSYFVEHSFVKQE